MTRILIVDDDEMVCDALCDLLGSMDHDTAYALTLNAGLESAEATPFDVVFLDVNLPDGNGLRGIPQFRNTPSKPEVIIITGEGDPDGAELAIVNRAWDYIQKPISVKKIQLPLIRVLQYREEKRIAAVPFALKRDGIVGNSPAMRHCFELLAQASRTDAPVILTGETGTGKELFARAIHANSHRRGNEFVAVDCAALPETLVESALFGSVKGSFTGADRSREGIIRSSDGGSLFLDEIGELSVEMQSAFLRVLQEKRFRPVGGKREIQSDFRLIAATHRNLDEMVASGCFRRDLYFRLKAMTITLPPLREHKDDIQAIVFHYLAKFCKRYGSGTKGLSTDFIETINHYGWPGNVRELVQAVDTALAAAGDSPTLFPIHLPPHIRTRLLRDRFKKNIRTEIKGHPAPTPFPAFKELMLSTEKSYFEDLLAHTRRDVNAVCRISDLSRSQVYKILKKHRISK